MLPATKPKTKVSLNNKTGLLEVYCTETGRLLAIQQTMDEALYERRKEIMVERLLPDGSSVLVEPSVDPAQLVGFRHKEYSSYVVDLICQRIVEGESLTKICNGTNGFPTYSEFCRWKKMEPGIKNQVDEARADRAEQMRDQIYAEMQGLDEDNIDSSKARIDALKYLAGTDDKQKYGSAKSEVVAAAPVQIIISTGINRSLASGGGDVVETKLINEENN